MIPVIDAAAHDNHRAPVRLNRVVGELAGGVNHHIGIDARKFFLPTRRVGRVVFVGTRALAAKPRVNSVVGKRQIVNRCDKLHTVTRFNFLNGNGAANHRVCASVVAEVRQKNFDDIIALAQD